MTTFATRKTSTPPADSALEEILREIAVPMQIPVGAEEHFQKAVDTPFEDQLDYSFSRAFLDRMEKDPAWPGWIHRKEADKK